MDIQSSPPQYRPSVDRLYPNIPTDFQVTNIFFLVIYRYMTPFNRHFPILPFSASPESGAIGGGSTVVPYVT